MTRLTTFTLTCFAISIAGVADAAESTGVKVGWESANGQVLLSELNCTSCHKTGDRSLPIAPRQAPRLGNVGQRIAPEYLRRFLSNPHGVKPGTPMPDLLHGVPDTDRDKSIESLVHFLASLGGPFETTSPGIDPKVADHGALLFHSVGCVACHAAFQAAPTHKIDPAFAFKKKFNDDGEVIPEVETGRVVIPLGRLAEKTSAAQLARFIGHPARVRPSGRMPSLELSGAQATSIAAYLTSGQVDQLGKPTQHRPFELNDELVTRGRELFATIGCASCHDTSVQPESIELDWVLSGAKVEGFDDKNNSSPGNETPAKAIDGNVNTKYLNFGAVNSGLLIRLPQPLIITGLAITSANDHEDRDPTAYLLEGSNDEQQWHRVDERDLANFTARHQEQSYRFENEDAWSTWRLTITKIRNAGADSTQFSEVRFYSSEKPKPGIASRHKARMLAELDPNAKAGCAAETVASGRPKFDLSKEQRIALAAAIGSQQQNSKPLDPKAAIELTMTTLRCYACHERDGKGGPSSSISNYFGYEKLVDFGDEGRLPPPLEHVGAKLTEAGFNDVFAGDRYRSYMATRMPQFGLKNVGHLANLFADADTAKIAAHTPSEFSPKLINDGRTLVGKGRLACINCHVWGDSGLPGAEGMDLLKTARRIKPAWFHAWLLDPQKLKRGTRMPTGWPFGKSLYADIQNGDVDRQIDAAWAYLSAGPRGGFPKGLSPKDSTRLVVTDTPLVFRTFVNGVSAHTILVGFREQSHIAFDANRVRSVLAWSGEFVSTRPTWDGRAGQYTSIPNESLVNFPDGPPFAFLESPNDAWPGDVPKANVGSTRTPEGWRFRGYRYSKNRHPTFLYEIGDVRVEETPAAVFQQNTSAMERRFRLTAKTPSSTLNFLVARGKEIIEEDGIYVVDGAARYTVNAVDSVPVIREVAEGVELLLPVQFRNNDAAFTIGVSW